MTDPQSPRPVIYAKKPVRTRIHKQPEVARHVQPPQHLARHGLMAISEQQQDVAEETKQP